MGGLMMADVLAGNFYMSNSVFNSNLSMLVTCWYIVNHNIPFTKFNLWDLISDNVSKFVPLGNVMDLCTTMFNLSLLHLSAPTPARCRATSRPMPSTATSS